MSQSTRSTWVLNTSRDGNSTTPMASLFQCLSTLSVIFFSPLQYSFMFPVRKAETVSEMTEVKPSLDHDHWGPLLLIKGVKRSNLYIQQELPLICRKSFILSFCSDSFWLPQPVVFSHLLIAVRVFPGLAEILLRLKRPFTLEVDSAWCRDPFRSSLWVVAIPVPHSKMVLRAYFHKEIKSRPNVHTNITKRHQTSPE